MIEPFRNRPLAEIYPYVGLDALYLKVRHNHRVVSQALVIAIGARETGKREVLGGAIGASEEPAFWAEFLRGLSAGGWLGCSWSRLHLRQVQVLAMPTKG